MAKGNSVSRRGNATAQHNGGARRAVVASRRAAGTLVQTKRRATHATRLLTVNAPTLSGKKQRESTPRMSGLRTVNAPGQKRRTMGGSSVHAVNAPRHQW